MHLLQLFVSASFSVFTVFSLGDCDQKQLPLHVESEVVSAEFKPVLDAFRQNFIDGWERAGASVAIFYKGKLVLDAWGGYADAQARRKWRKNTISPVCSTGKGVLAACMALLVDRKAVDYDDLVTKHWPGYGKNGKENTTVQMLISHMAGLYYIDRMVSFEEANDHNAMREILENERPQYEPGTKAGYQAATIGWLVDQLIRHCDKKHRSSGQFLREEIADKYEIDQHIGLPASEQHRVARTILPTERSTLDEFLTTPQLVVQKRDKAPKEPLFAKAVEFLPWFYFPDLNNADYFRMEQGATFGLGNARSLAQIFNKIITKELISEQTLRRIENTVVNGTDIVSDWVGGFGFRQYDFGDFKGFGHNGFGCQEIIADSKNELVIGYVTNDIKVGSAPNCRTFSRIQNAMFEVVRKLGNSGRHYEL